MLSKVTHFVSHEPSIDSELLLRMLNCLYRVHSVHSELYADDVAAWPTRYASYVTHIQERLRGETRWDHCIRSM
jgi:hypothetical protein